MAIPEQSGRQVRREDFIGAHACLERLAQQFIRGCLGEGGQARLQSGELDRLAFACIYLCENISFEGMDNFWDVIRECEAAVESVSMLPQFDRLPWRLCAERGGPEDFRSLDWTQELINDLGHPSSGIRAYCQRVAWFVRRNLEREYATEILLQNVANKLGGWADALSLCRELYASDEEFFAQAEGQDFGQFQDQYESRIEHAKGIGLGVFRVDFLAFEAKIHEIIHSVSLNLPVLDLE